MIGVISAVIAVLGAVVTVALGYRVQTQLKSREHMDYMSKYRDALLWAAFDLQSRLYNILHGYEVTRRPGQKGFLQAFLVEGTERQADYVKRSTAFLFAEYLGWVEIFRRDLQFLDLGDSQTNRQIMFLLHKISGTLNAANTSDAECFRIFRADQRARRAHDRGGQQTRRAPMPRLRRILLHARGRRSVRRMGPGTPRPRRACST